MRDILGELPKRVSSALSCRCAPGRWATGGSDDPITAEALYPRWERFFRPEDTIITETGSSSVGLGFARLPTGATFHNQTLWGSIGWATPAAFGAAVAHPHGRVILVTGDGSHQLTAQEISQFGTPGPAANHLRAQQQRLSRRAVPLQDPNIAYNDIASWNYAEIPHALGCNDWYTARATTCSELDNAMTVAAQADAGAYIEVVTDTYAASNCDATPRQPGDPLQHLMATTALVGGRRHGGQHRIAAAARACPSKLMKGRLTHRARPTSAREIRDYLLRLS